MSLKIQKLQRILYFKSIVVNKTLIWTLIVNYIKEIGRKLK